MCVELMLNAVNLTFVALARAARRGGPGVRHLGDDGCGRGSRGRAGDRHRGVPPLSRPVNLRNINLLQAADAHAMLLLQAAAAAAHPLSGHGRRVGSGCCRCCRCSASSSTGSSRWLGVDVGPADPSAAPHGGDAHAVEHAAPTAMRITRRRGIRWPSWSNVIGAGRGRLAFALAVAIFLACAARGRSSEPFVQRYFSWMPVGALQIDAAFQLDQLSIVMMLVVTGVGSLIHLFASATCRTTRATRATSRT